MLDPPPGGDPTVVVGHTRDALNDQENTMATQVALDTAIAPHIAAINSFDVDAIMATFAEDALVNDVAREFWGHERIRAFVSRELAGDHVTLEPVEAVDNAGMWCVRCRYQGDYDKA